MISVGSEWLLAICFLIYILSFVIELRQVYCHAPKLRLLLISSKIKTNNLNQKNGQIINKQRLINNKRNTWPKRILGSTQYFWTKSTKRWRLRRIKPVVYSIENEIK